jgi:hypothetical protein
MTTRPGYVWDDVNEEWVKIGQAAVIAPVSYQATEPTSPATGDIWIDSDDEVPGITSSLNYRWRKIATGGETSLSGVDNSGLPLAYNPGYEQVYLNGVLLYRGSDYVATTGTTITGLTALVANDTVEVLSFVTAPIGDTYTQAAADAKFSNGLRTSQFFHVKDVKSSGTQGGTFTSGAYRIRDLNTVLTNTISGASLSANRITLPAGTYYVEGSAPAYKTDFHKAIIYSPSSATTLMVGTAELSGGGNDTTSRSLISGSITFTGTGTIELQHSCTNTVATWGFGRAGGMSFDEVYSEIKIWKVA